MTVKAVFFDLDGTLLDSAPDFVVTLHQLMDEYQLPRISEADIRATVSDGARALTTLAFNMQANESGFSERLERLLTLYCQHMGNHCMLFDGMEQLIQRIKSDPLFWGIITNKPSRFTDPILERLNLNNPPNLVLCPDHVTRAKPDPEALLLACQKVGCKPEEAIYIGDHQRDIDCGIAAGSPTIAVSFGYTKKEDDIAQWNADHIAHNCDDIWRIIQSYQ